MPDTAKAGSNRSPSGDVAGLSLREMLSIPYRIVAHTAEGVGGEWTRRAAYPELPGCTAEAETIEAALRLLERRRIEIIVAMMRARRQPPLPRPPLRDCDPEGMARSLGLAELVAGKLGRTSLPEI